MKVADIPQPKGRNGTKLQTMRVAEVMSGNVRSAGQTTRSGLRMTTAPHRHLPVIHQGTLVGLVSTDDVVKAR